MLIESALSVYTHVIVVVVTAVIVVIVVVVSNISKYPTVMDPRDNT